MTTTAAKGAHRSRPLGPLTDKELSDKEYMQAYVEAQHESYAELLKEWHDARTLNADLLEALEAIEKQDWAAMLKVVPEGIEHRADRYNTVESFNGGGTYEEDARYTAPAQWKLVQAFIQHAKARLRTCI